MRRWVHAGVSNTARYLHTATLLEDGKVLLVGGGVGAFCDCCCVPDPSSSSNSSAELYDPATETWSYTGSLNTARMSHAATLLENGQVLVTGGVADVYGKLPLTGAELYDPATGGWRPTGSFNTIQASHSTTRLASGKVLAVGHADDGFPYRAELYDPATETWSNTNSPNIRGDLIASTILLPNGKVLAVSGDSAALYDPTTEIWSSAGNPGLQPVAPQAMTLLASGKVLVIMAFGAQLYDPNEGTWRITGSPRAMRTIGKDRARPLPSYTATPLPNGQALVAGGYSSHSRPKGEELYDPATEKWSYTSRLIAARHYHTATALPDGRVLVAGGVDEGTDQTTFPHSSAELYDPDTGPIFNPNITGASVAGKKLFVTGENFDPGAVILLNGEERKTRNDDQNPATKLIGRKAGKKIKAGDKLQVRNPNGTVSQEFTFTGV